ncbi:MAG: hypothetical protein JWN70_4978, partial [Planctomycetaceae bacterium]|nr:hypothetical protein [Planctomycetaceae bacterium]
MRVLKLARVRPCLRRVCDALPRGVLQKLGEPGGVSPRIPGTVGWALLPVFAVFRDLRMAIQRATSKDTGKSAHLTTKNPGAYAARLTCHLRGADRLGVRCRRRGLTLFEVLIALVIFVGAMAAIGQLVANGVRAALQARFQTQAAMMCEAKLAEV